MSVRISEYADHRGYRIEIDGQEVKELVDFTFIAGEPGGVARLHVKTLATKPFELDVDRCSVDVEVRLPDSFAAVLSALREMTDDLEARWDMNDPRTNPGIKHNVARAREAIALAEKETEA